VEATSLLSADVRLPRFLDDLDTIDPLGLRKGTNVLLLKLVNETGDWLGCVRLVHEEGRPAKGIQVRLTPEP
jgi:hypothetical protein